MIKFCVMSCRKEFADSAPLQQHDKRMAEGNFFPDGLTRLRRKELNHALEKNAKIRADLAVSRAGMETISSPDRQDESRRFRFVLPHIWNRANTSTVCTEIVKMSVLSKYLPRWVIGLLGYWPAGLLDSVPQPSFGGYLK